MMKKRTKMPSDTWSEGIFSAKTAFLRAMYI